MNLTIMLPLLTEPVYKVVCYHTNWSQYRNKPAKFTPKDIDASLCTHLVYAFAKIADGKLAIQEWNDKGGKRQTGPVSQKNLRVIVIVNIYQEQKCASKNHNIMLT